MEERQLSRPTEGNKEFHLYSETTAQEAKAALYRKNNTTKELEIVNFISNRFSPDQQKLTILEKEMLSLSVAIWANWAFQHDIYGHHTQIHMDRNIFNVAQGMKKTNLWVEKWMAFMDLFDYSVETTIEETEMEHPEGLSHIY